MKVLSFFMVLIIGSSAASQDSLAFKVKVKNVVVPQKAIILDSISNGYYWYSGLVRFDLESPLDSVRIHIYLEDVPFQRYRIMKDPYAGIGEDTICGNARYRLIDSYCSGDTGMLKPKSGCTIYWRYSTKNSRNHCRIKIGVGNFYYANTMIKTVNKQGSLIGKHNFEYNDLGLLAVRRDSVEVSQSLMIKIPQYTIDGQLLVDDTTDPFVINSYDSQGRTVFRQEASSNGMLVNFIYGYAYDSLSRAVRRVNLNFGATPNNPGVPFNTELIQYDNQDRVSLCETNYRVEKFSCQKPYDFIEGKLTTNYIYNRSSTFLVDSIIRCYYDDNRNSRLVSKITEHLTYGITGLLEEDHSISQGYDDLGACWGTQYYFETKANFFHDTFGNLSLVQSTERKSTDSPFLSISPSICSRREYDQQGNIINQFDFCSPDERLVFKAEYNLQNFISQMTTYSSDTLETIFQWELLDLEKSKPFLHD